MSVAGAFGGAVFAFSTLTWTYSSGSEVFSLNNALIAALIYALVCYDERAGRGMYPAGRVGALCFVGALACTNQHTVVFYVGPFAVWVLLSGAMRHGWSGGALLVGFAWCVCVCVCVCVCLRSHIELCLCA